MKTLHVPRRQKMLSALKNALPAALNGLLGGLVDAKKLV